MFPPKITKLKFTNRLKHLTACSVGRKYSEIQLSDFLDATTNSRTGSPGLRLHPPTVWLTYINAVNSYFGRYGVNIGPSDFSPSGKSLRNFRDYLWENEVSENAKEL